MRRFFIAGNWKMNGNQQSCRHLLTSISASTPSVQPVEIAVFPPFTYLFECATYLSRSGIFWGAQNVSAYPDGAHTGEISVAMLKDLGCRYVIVGHSERRKLYRETNQDIGSKFQAAMQGGLIPILCVGETLEEHHAKKTLSVVREQLAVVLTLKDNCTNFSEAVIAYEPVWAIGTGLAAAPEQAQEVHAAIRAQLKESAGSHDAERMRILYGGSVTPDNASALFAMPDIDGALVGGASLDAQKFLKIGAAGVKTKTEP